MAVSHQPSVVSSQQLAVSDWQLVGSAYCLNARRIWLRPSESLIFADFTDDADFGVYATKPRLPRRREN